MNICCVERRSFMGKSPLQIVTAVDAASNALRQDIFASYFTPGIKISESLLAERYGVSRHTIREAIAHLLSSGILTKSPNRGTFVKKISLDDVREIFQLRKLLEVEAVHRIGDMGQIPPDIFTALHNIENVDTAADWPQYVTMDARFHQSLVDAVNSKRLSRMYDIIVAEVQLCIVQSQELLRGFAADAFDHRVIVSNLEAGETAEAAAFLEKHLDSAVERFEKAFARRKIAK